VLFDLRKDLMPEGGREPTEPQLQARTETVEKWLSSIDKRLKSLRDGRKELNQELNDSHHETMRQELFKISNDQKKKLDGMYRQVQEFKELLGTIAKDWKAMPGFEGWKQDPCKYFRLLPSLSSSSSSSSYFFSSPYSEKKEEKVFSIETSEGALQTFYDNISNGITNINDPVLFDLRKDLMPEGGREPTEPQLQARTETVEKWLSSIDKRLKSLRDGRKELNQELNDSHHETMRQELFKISNDQKKKLDGMYRQVQEFKELLGTIAKDWKAMPGFESWKQDPLSYFLSK